MRGGAGGGASFGRLYSMMHVLSPEDGKTNAIVSARDDSSTIGANSDAVYGFSMTPLALARCGVLIPLSLAPVEIVMELGLVKRTMSVRRMKELGIGLMLNKPERGN